ncbi:MAG TPA: hypothetical protein VE617_08485 [Propionibacteriaceae bacterium]|nr:hypothetical protein [Propionibacteriaceae bacterium]
MSLSRQALIDALLQEWPAEEREAFAVYFVRFAGQLDDQSRP